MDYSYKLSIITVNLNNKEGLQKTIDSVINQTCQVFEWIIIDGGSTDGSKELIEKHSAHINYWVSEPDKGIYNAMNKGIKVSNGEYLLFLNSGDYLYDTKVLEKTIKFFKNDYFYVGKEISKKGIAELKSTRKDEIVHTLMSSSLRHQSMFIKKEVFEIFGLYDESLKYVADWWLTYKALYLNDATISLIPYIISVFDNQGISTIYYKEVARERDKIIKECSMPNLVYIYYQFYRDNLLIIKLIRKFKPIYKIFFYLSQFIYSNKISNFRNKFKN